MGIDNLTHVKKGQRLSAYTVNSIIDAVQGTEKPGNFKPGTGIRAETLFYTDVAIPPYSIFPLINNATSTYDTFYAKYKVEKYTASHTAQYVPGLYGTNGRLEIPAGVSFFGRIITSDWDSPIVVSDYADNAKKCGFKENSWEATITNDGLVLNGKAPQKDNTYYSRLPQHTADIYVLELVRDIEPAEDKNEYICVKPGEAWVLDRERLQSNLYCDCTERETEATCELLKQKYRLGEYVYNGTHLTCHAQDYYGKKIYYYGLRDIYGTIWVDRMYIPPDLEGWAEEEITGYDPSADYQIKLARSIKWRGETIIEAGSSLLNHNSTIEVGTPVLCRWFVTLERWIVIEAACESDPNYVPSSEEEGEY